MRKEVLIGMINQQIKIKKAKKGFIELRGWLNQFISKNAFSNSNDSEKNKLLNKRTQ
jgi:hypothetical protein